MLERARLILRAAIRAELTAAVALEAFGAWWADCAMRRARKVSEQFRRNRP